MTNYGEAIVPPHKCLKESYPMTTVTTIPPMKDGKVSQGCMQTWFECAVTNAVWKKSGVFLFRPAEDGEAILTIVAGKLETLSKANGESVILINLTIGGSAERYIVNRDKFNSRYDVQDETIRMDGNTWQYATAKGEVNGFYYNGDKPFHFDAPWGEEMLVEKGDFIARPVGGGTADIYRIEKDTFADTYAPKV